MIPSRPKVVSNHGTPAYGYRPELVSVSSMLRSAAERVIQALS